MAVTNYASILTELNSFTERAYSQAQVDTFIGLAEADFNLYLGPNYARETSDTVTTDAEGLATLPTGFVHLISLVGAYGPLDLVTWDEIDRYNPFAQGGVPDRCAIQGSQIRVAPILAADFDLNYEARLAGLSASNASNWLLTSAPQAYFWAVMGQAAAFEENWQVAAGMDQRARGVINDLGIQSTVAQFGRASFRMRGATP